MAAMLGALAAMPDISSLLQSQATRLANIETLVRTIQSPSNSTDCWLDAKAAAEYMGVSAGTFDKYRYKTNPRIVGCALDGKTLFKKSDLDNFIRLYAIKSKEPS
jgi:hypothetical protein